VWSVMSGIFMIECYRCENPLTTCPFATFPLTNSPLATWLEIFSGGKGEAFAGAGASGSVLFF
jgi:hypothetical protein